MKLKPMALAAIAWVWSWLVWTWAKVKAGGNQVIDPPPQRIKYYMLFVLAVAVGGAWFGGTVVSWFDRSVLGPLHSAAVPLAQPVMLLPKGAVFPSEMSEKLADAPKPHLEAMPEPLPAPVKPSAEGKRKGKRKPKQEAWSPF